MQLQFCKVVFDRFAEYCRSMRARSPRLFSGQRVRALRKRSGMSQQQMAQRLDISVSYLSQIENDERPLTPTVLLALARSFPQDWGDVGGAEGEADLTGALSAASDSSISGSPLTEDQLQRAIQKHPQLVERLLANLVDNALQYGASPVVVRAGMQGGGFWLEVRDSGPGIPPDQHEQALQAFYRGDPGRARPGTGLGLAIVREAALRLGAQLTLHQGPAGFTVRLDGPLAP